jgi:hypothetical protein
MCQIKGARQTQSYYFAMCQNKAALPCVIYLSCVSWAAHGKKSLCRVPDFMHTTNTQAQMLNAQAHGKSAISGSARRQNVSAV